MGSHRQEVGRLGEDRAAAWYVERGWSIVERNWRCREGELDLVVARAGVLVVCEVKARTSDRFGSPAEAVTADKQRRIRHLARLLLHERELRPTSIRFDVAAVHPTRLEVIEGAF